MQLRWRGLPLNSSPTDVVVTRDGAVWFTDRRRRRARPRPVLPARVYRLDPRTGELTAMADGIRRPHGLAFSPDETVLYVRDGRGGRLYAFDVRRNHLFNQRLLDPRRAHLHEHQGAHTAQRHVELFLGRLGLVGLTPRDGSGRAAGPEAG